MAGSSRRGSPSARLLDIAIEAAADIGAEVSLLDLSNLDLPVYDPDVSIAAMPQGALALRQIVSGHDGLLIVTPEYNGSVPPLLTNALDWSSCPAFGDRRLTPYRGKIATLMAVSDGPNSGERCLDHLRSILSRMGILVLPDEMSLSLADTVSDAALFDPATRDHVRRQVSQLVGTLRLCCREGSPT